MDARLTLLPKPDRDRLTARLKDLRQKLYDCDTDAHAEAKAFLADLRNVAEEYPVAKPIYLTALRATLRGWSDEMGMLCVLKALEET